jgi:hypothetical protein
MNNGKVRAVALTRETLQDDPTLWKQIEDMQFRLIYATPEIILAPSSYFNRVILHETTESPFLDNLVAVALDECHVLPAGWGEWRPSYKGIGRLRDLLSKAVFVALSATLPPDWLRATISEAHLRAPAIVKQSIRRMNIVTWVVEIEGPGFTDLAVLVPQGITAPAEIPLTFLFVDSRAETIAIAEYLRELLPQQFRAQDVIRSYSSTTGALTQARTKELIDSGDCHIVVCTDTLGMGVHFKRTILRVVQWKLHSEMHIGTLEQRSGRGGRDMSTTSLTLIFATRANLRPRTLDSTAEETSPDSQEPSAGDGDSSFAAPESNTDPESSTSGPIGTPLEFNVAVTPDNWETVKPFLSLMYSATPTGNAKRRTERLQPHLQWHINTHGCRIDQKMCYFDDENKWGVECNTGFQDCDPCMVRALLGSGFTGEEPTEAPIIHGISLNLTCTYKRVFGSDRPTKSVRQATRLTIQRQPVEPERLKFVENAIRSWRENDLAGMLQRDALAIGPTVVFKDEAINTIIARYRNFRSMEDLKAVLQTCGLRFPNALLTPYLDNLFITITLAFAESVSILKGKAPAQESRAPQHHSQPAGSTLGQQHPPALHNSFQPPPVVSVPVQPAPAPAPTTLRNSFQPPPAISVPVPPTPAPTPATRPAVPFIPVPICPLPDLTVVTQKDNNDANPDDNGHFKIKIDLKRIREEDPTWFEEFLKTRKRRHAARTTET